MSTTKPDIGVFDANRRELGMLDLQIEHTARTVELMRLNTDDLRSLGGLQDIYLNSALVAFMASNQQKLTPRATVLAETLRTSMHMLMRELLAEAKKKGLAS